MKKRLDFLPLYTIAILAIVGTVMYLNRPEELKVPVALEAQIQRNIASVEDQVKALADQLVLGSTGRIYEFSDGKMNIEPNDFTVENDEIKVDLLAKLRQKVPAGTPFRIVVANSKFSKQVVLSINKNPRMAINWEEKARQLVNGNGLALETYTLGSSSDENVKSLEDFLLRIPEHVVREGLISQNSTKCVQLNEPNKDWNYRNGALVIQVIAAENFALDDTTGTADRSRAKLLLEYSIFKGTEKHDPRCQQVASI